MTKKPRNKKYNPERNYSRAAKQITKPLAIVYTIKNEPLVVNAKTKKRAILTETLFKAFHTVQYQWTVYTAVMLENALGERYLNILECSPERACYKDDISDLLLEKHIEHAASTKRMDRVNLGWVAFPISCDVSEKEIAELLEIHEDCWTRHERGNVLLDDELTLDQQIENELMKVGL